MIINKIKKLNIIKKVGKKTLVITTALLVLGLSYSAYASGILVFKNSDGGSLLSLNLSIDTYNEGTKTFSDSSGKSNNAVLSNTATFTSDRNNKESSALNFNGSSDYLLVNNVVVSNPTALTISAWFKKETGGSSYECVLHQGGGSSIGSTAYWLGLETDDYLNATIGANAGVGWGAGRTNVKATPGQWYHLLATWDGSVVKVYVNGQYNKQYNLSSYSGLSTPTRIGASDNGSNYQFRGSVQDVGIYNRSFTDEEVKDLYNFTQPKLMISSINSGLVGHWTLDGDDYDTATNKVTDKTPYENTAINYGATPTTDRNGKINGAMSFDGVNNDSIDIPNTGLYTNFTFSAWVYNEQGGDSRHSLFSSHWEVVGTSVCYYSYGFANQYWRCSPSNVVPYNQWTLVTTTWDGSIMRHYANGLLVWTDSKSSSGTNQSISTIAGYVGRKFKGSISDARIYNRTLSSEEVTSLHDSYQPSVSGSSLQKGLVLDMPLTSDWTKSSTPGSEIMVDKTPYGNDGQNYGGVVSSEGILLQNSGNRVATNFSVPNARGTISIWYKPLYAPSDASRDSILYSTGSSWVSNSFAFHLRNCCGAPYDNILYMKDSNNSDLAFEWDRPSGQSNEWVNLTIVFEAKNYIKLYNNGVLVASSWGKNTGDFNFPSIFNIGAISASSVSAKGVVSNLKIYNRALDATEVMSLYDQGR